MEFLFFYAIFALTTSFASVYQILIPVIDFRKSEGYEVESTFIVYVTFFILNVILAPVVFLSCIVPSMCDRFQAALYKGLFPEE